MDDLVSRIHDHLFNCNAKDFELNHTKLEATRSKLKTLRELKEKIEATNAIEKYEGRQIENFRHWFSYFCKHQQSPDMGGIDLLTFDAICFAFPDISPRRFELIRGYWMPLRKWIQTQCSEKPLNKDRMSYIGRDLIKSSDLRGRFDKEVRNFIRSKSATPRSDVLGNGLDPLGSEAGQRSPPDERIPPGLGSKKRKLDQSGEDSTDNNPGHQEPLKQQQLSPRLPQGSAGSFSMTVDDLCSTLERASARQWKVEVLVPGLREPLLGLTGCIGWCLITTGQGTPKLFAPAKTTQEIVRDLLPRDKVLSYLQNELFSDTVLHIRKFSGVPLIYLPSGMIMLMSGNGLQNIGVTVKSVQTEKERKKNAMLAEGARLFGTQRL